MVDCEGWAKTNVRLIYYETNLDCKRCEGHLVIVCQHCRCVISAFEDAVCGSYRHFSRDYRFRKNYQDLRKVEEKIIDYSQLIK